MKLYSIKNKKTGKTLKQTVAEYLSTSSKWDYGDFSYLRDRTITYLCSHSGNPGYSYWTDYERERIIWLDSKEWECEFRQEVLKHRNVV